MLIQVHAPIEDYRLDPALEHLRDCQRCKLSPSATDTSAKQVVMPVGSLDAQMGVILESPGQIENETGFTVSGPSYILIDWLVNKYGFDEHRDFLRFNTTMCFAGTKKATKQHIKQCRHNLDYILANSPNMRLIIPVGEIALKAIEGDDAVLSLRVGRPGHKSWINANGMDTGRKLYSIPVKHPAWLLRLENPIGKAKATQQYHSHLKFIRDFYDNLDNIEHYQIPYKYHICNTVEEGYYWADFIVSNSSIDHVVIDFETSEIMAGCWAIPLCLAVGFELEGEIHCIVFPFKQCVTNIDSRVVKPKHGKKIFSHKWGLIEWFEKEPEFENKIINILRPVLTGQKCYISAWNAKFDSRTMDENYGFPLIPHLDQVPEPGFDLSKKVPPRDPMLLARYVNSDLRSLSLKTLLSAMLPLLADEKDPIESALEYLYGKQIIEETGYMLMAVKPPEDMPEEQIFEWGNKYSDWVEECDRAKEKIKKLKAKKTKKKTKDETEEKIKLPPCPLSGQAFQIVESNWCPNIRNIRSKILFERAAFDSGAEKDITDRLLQMLDDAEFMSIGQSLPDDIWF